MKKVSRIGALFWFLVVGALASMLIFPWLGIPPLFEVSEGREGVVVQEMIDHAELILPLRHGELIPSKPPLFHWFALTAAKLNHHFTAFELRLPSATGAVGLVLLTFLLGVRFLSIRTGILAAGFLLSSYSFTRAAVNGRVDVLLCFFATAAIARWLFAARKEVLPAAEGTATPEFDIPSINSSVYWQVGVLAGLGILTKGPLGLLIPILAIGGCSLMLGGPKAMLTTIRKGWVAALVLALPWYVAAYISGRQHFVDRQLVFENFKRFAGGDGITMKPPWYYLLSFWDYSLPLSVLFAFYLFKRFRPGFSTAIPDEPTRKRFHFLERSALTWLVVLVLFFSLAVGKRKSYLLPILPAVSLLIAAWIDVSWDKLRAALSDTQRLKRVKAVGYVVWTVVVISAMGAVVSSYLCCTVPTTEQSSFRQTLAAVHQVFTAHQSLIGPAFSLLAIGSFALWYFASSLRSPSFLFGAAFLFAQLAVGTIGNTLLAAKGVTHSFQSIAAKVNELVPPDAGITFIKDKKDESFDGFFFDVHRRIGLQEQTVPVTKAGYYLARESWYAAQLEDVISDSAELFRGGRIFRPERTRVVLFRYTPPAPTAPQEKPLPSAPAAALPDRPAAASPSDLTLQILPQPAPLQTPGPQSFAQPSATPELAALPPAPSSSPAHPDQSSPGLPPE